MRCCVKVAWIGRYGDAVHSLSFQGCASQDDSQALDDLTSRYPDHNLPFWSKDIPSFLVIENRDVLLIMA